MNRVGDGRVEIVTVGHAIVDVLAPVADGAVADLGLTKGTMTLVDDEESERIHATFASATAVSGGSSANTAVGLASLGVDVAFVGKVRDDGFGEVFSRDIRAAGVRYEVAFGTEGPGTGRCMIMVTPDAEKTMCTTLGIGNLLGPDDVDVAAIAAARVVYLEGYLCGLEHTDPTVERVVSEARAAGTAVALSLSDPFWVQIHGRDFDRLLDRVDILFANEQEACGMAHTTDVEAAVRSLGGRCATVVVTRGPAGSLVASDGSLIAVPAAPVERVVDTTGAGDMFAAGFLYGVVRDLSVADSARLGSVVAAEVVSHMGARPLVPLHGLAATAGLTQARHPG